MPNWKGGRIQRGRYIHLHKPDHPFSGKQGYIAEHRLIMEKKIGRYLTKQEVVHHINGDPQDNRIENLILFKNSGEHKRIAHNDIPWNKGLKGIMPIPWNKGTKGKMPIPWNKGKKGLIIAWNKGLTRKNDLRIAQPWLGKKRPNLKNTNAGKTMFKKGQIPWNKK